MKVYGHNCYKCQTTESLSPKRIQPNGSIIFICKACRKAAYQLFKSRMAPPQRKDTKQREWGVWAKQKNSAISAKYANKQFMKLRGLIYDESA